MSEWRISVTNYPHPDIKTGQHTNGPATVWVEWNGQWVNTRCTKLHKVMMELEKNGTDRIINGTWNEREA